MKKFIILLCVVSVVTSAKVTKVASAKGGKSKSENYISLTTVAPNFHHSPDHRESYYHIDDYIQKNYEQFVNVLEEYKAKLKKFKESFFGRVEGVNVQVQLISRSIKEFENRLYPLEFLDNTKKHCIAKYKASIPVVDVVKTDINKCIAEANIELKGILGGPETVVESLKGNYSRIFDGGVKQCRSEYDHSYDKLTRCVTEVAEEARKFIVKNQKEFDIELDLAECTAKAYAKTAIGCVYAIETRTITSKAEANLLINRCFMGEDECPPCDPYTCSESVTVKADYNNKTMLNPFYRRDTSTSCIMLNVE